MFDDLLPSFGIRVSSTGRRRWFCFYRIDGRQVRQQLGEYLTGEGGVSLAQAREAARAAMASAAQACDPRARPAEILPDEARERFADVVDDYVRLHVNVHLKASTATGYRNHLRRLSERWTSKRIRAVSRRDVLDVLDEHTANGKLAQARLVFAIVNTFFAWCVERGLLIRSPIEGMRSPARVAPRDRVLSDAEVSALWAASAALGYPYGPFFRLLLLTGQREGEVARMRREHVREQIWQIPDTKRGTPHRITLPKLADAELEAMPIFVEGPFLFTSTGGKKPINGFSKAKVRRGASNGGPAALRRAGALADSRFTSNRGIGHGAPRCAPARHRSGAQPPIGARLRYRARVQRLQLRRRDRRCARALERPYRSACRRCQGRVDELGRSIMSEATETLACLGG